MTGQTASTYDIHVKLGETWHLKDRNVKQEIQDALEKSKGQLVDLYFLGGPWDMRITADFTEVTDVIKFRYELKSLGMWETEITPVATVKTLNEIVERSREQVTPRR
jgi:uncharacterized protein with GYD domain